MLRKSHISLDRHASELTTEIAKKGKVFNPSPFSVASTSVRLKFLTWFSLLLSSPLAHPEPVYQAHREPQALQELQEPQAPPPALLALVLVLLVPAAAAAESPLFPSSHTLPTLR